MSRRARLLGIPEGHQLRSVEVVLSLVLGASLIAALAAKARAPAPSLLVIAGIVVALIPGVPVPRLTPDLVLLVVLPPLLSAAAEEQNALGLLRNWRPITFLAVGLVLVSAAVTAAVAAPLLHIAGPVALVLGAIVASTDPVAVTALARRLRLPARLELIVSAESLANDATSLVLFMLGLSLVTAGGGIHAGHLAVELVHLAGGGAVTGAAVAAVAALARRRTDDPVAQTVLSLVTPYAAYVAAEAWGGAGVTSVVVSGVITGTVVNRRVAPQVRLQLEAVTDTVVFLLESVIFALIGLQIPTLVRELHGTLGTWLLPALALSATVVAVRFLGVSLLVLLTRRSPGQSPAAARPVASRLRTSLVLTWAGTRGVVPLAAALSLPLTVNGGGPFPARSLLILVAASVSVVTLVVQGLTLAPLTERTGVVEPNERLSSMQELARASMQQAARFRLAELSTAEAASPAVIDELEEILGLRERATGPGAQSYAEDIRTLRQDLLSHERRALDELHNRGGITDNVWRELRRSLDLQATTTDDS